jgi:phage terminase small subunit
MLINWLRTAKLLAGRPQSAIYARGEVTRLSEGPDGRGMEMNGLPGNALTPKQKSFVIEYLSDLNATGAARRAGYSQRTANEQGARLLAKPSVAEAVREAQKARGARLRITQDDVLAGLLREATSSGPGTSQAGRILAWTQLGRHLGMFRDRTQQIGPDGRPIDRFRPVILQVIRRV